mmetsp:Transcript_54298/g.162487  ORF Transcript_54298/g.162487 Transcript_54298/m.162487 type:complete len:927 (-) Transcript_54298:214-2994(-)
MPHGKKGRSSNKKKHKGNTNARRSGNVNRSGNVDTSAQGGGVGSRIPSNVLQGKSPNFNEFEKTNALQENYPTVYSRYKKATESFIRYMMDQCPEEIRGARTVDALCTVADWMEGQRHILPRSILQDLKLAIRIRSRVAKSVYGGGDSGHKHFILVLTYCWTVLNRLPKEENFYDAVSKGAQTIGEVETAEKVNHFAALGELDNEDDDDATEDIEIFPSSPVPRPEPAPEPMSLDDLMKAEDRIDAILFLDELDELMGFVSRQYEVIMPNLVSNRRQGVPPSALVEMFLEASVATNMIIQKVQQLETDLQVQHEHFTTPYRLLATLVLPDVTRHVTEVLREHASMDCDERAVASFLGDCMECYFRNPSDDLNRKDDIVKEFCAEQGMNETGRLELQEVFNGLQKVVSLEVPIGPELSMNAGLASRYARVSGLSSHSWLPKCHFIGGDRSILHTIRLLQAFGEVVRNTPQDRQIVPKRGIFGSSPWRPGHSRKIHNDLDELLMSDILPSWVLMCRKGILSQHNLPRENEICALLVKLRAYVENPGRPTDWSTAFAVHALLTAILETDKIFDDIVDISKQSFGNYFEQVKHALKIAEQEKDTPLSRAYVQNMFSIAFLDNLGLDVFGNRAIWNPLCGGTILSYICYFGNLEGGCTLIDCRSQLRITMHLYHALRMTGILVKGQIPFLDMVFDVFSSSRAVWEGPLPKKGEFVQRFWVCFGMNPKAAKQFSHKAKNEVQRGSNRFHRRGPLDDIAPEFEESFRTRRLRPIEPSEISKSFRRFCDRDFHGVQDKYHTPDQRRRNKGSEIYEVSIRVNDTLDAIDEEQSVLAFNYVECGAQMEQFLCSLSRVLQWDPILSSARTFRQDKRQGFAFLFAQFLLGALDYADDPVDYEFMQCPLVPLTAMFLEKYFSSVSPLLLRWFTPVAIKD